ncbi:hypothetical protein Q4829_004414 [Salmonella enterica]|nr:hypothetical protein [Salmonella enterica]
MAATPKLSITKIKSVARCWFSVPRHCSKSIRDTVRRSAAGGETQKKKGQQDLTCWPLVLSGAMFP